MGVGVELDVDDVFRFVVLVRAWASRRIGGKEERPILFFLVVDDNNKDWGVACLNGIPRVF